MLITKHTKLQNRKKNSAHPRIEPRPTQHCSTVRCHAKQSEPVRRHFSERSEKEFGVMGGRT